MKRFYLDTFLCKAFLFLATYLGMLFVFGAVAFGTTAFAEELAIEKSIPSQVAVYVRVNHLEQRVKEINNSGLTNRVSKLKVVKKWWNGSQFEPVRQLAKAVEESTGRPFEDVLLDFAGDQMVFTRMVDRESKQSANLFLAQTQSAPFLADLVRVWNQFDSPRITKIPYKKTIYYRREILDEKKEVSETLFYCITGRCFILCNQEFAMKTVLKLQSTAKGKQAEEKNGSFGDSKNYSKYQESLPAKTSISVYLNPALIGNINTEGRRDRLFYKPLCALWEKSQFVFVAINLEQGIVLDAGAVNSQWRLESSPTLEKLQFLKSVPAESILIVAGGTSWAPLASWLESMHDTNSKKANRDRRALAGLLQGNDLYRDMLPQLGPQWGVFAVLQPQKNILPFDVLMRLQIQTAQKTRTQPAKKPKKQESDIASAIDNTLGAGLNFLCFVYNYDLPQKPAAKIKKSTEKDRSVRWANHLIDWSPGYSISPETLQLFSDHHWEKSLRKNSEKNRLIDQVHFQDIAKRYMPRASVVVWFDLKQLREGYSQNRKAVVSSVSKMKNQPSEFVEKKLDNLDNTLSMVDTLFARTSREKDIFRVTIGGVISSSSTTKKDTVKNTTKTIEK